MEYIIKKNGHVFARAYDPNAAQTDDVSIDVVKSVPPFPETDPGKGKYWDLDYIEGVLTWVQKDRPLSTEERLVEMENLMNTMLGVDSNG